LHEVVKRNADRWFKGEKYDVKKPAFHGSIQLGLKDYSAAGPGGDLLIGDALDLYLAAGCAKRVEFSANLWVRHDKLEYVVGYFYSLKAIE
jgi:hypothetical protein